MKGNKTMNTKRKVFVMDGVDCANCAAKMENAIRAIDGVTYVNISFMAQRMTLEADEEKFEKIVKQAVKICKKIDSDCTVEV